MLWDLFLGFLKVGCFAFGGAYGAIPLVRDVTLSNGWLTEDAFTYMIAVSESTPGSIMISMASYVGGDQAGLLGSLVASVAVVLPSFIVILLVMGLFNHFLNNRRFRSFLGGMTPAVMGIVWATGLTMTYSAIAPARVLDVKALLITLILAAAMLLWKPVFKKKLSPTGLICLSAVLGILFYQGRG